MNLGGPTKEKEKEKPQPKHVMLINSFDKQLGGTGLLKGRQASNSAKERKQSLPKLKFQQEQRRAGDHVQALGGILGQWNKPKPPTASTQHPELGYKQLNEFLMTNTPKAQLMGPLQPGGRPKSGGTNTTKIKQIYSATKDKPRNKILVSAANKPQLI